MLEAITTLLLAVHLLAMNVASAGPLAGAWLLHRGLKAGENERRPLLHASRRTFAWSLVALVVGSLVGGAMLIAPSEGMQAALRRFPPDAYWFAGSEILFSAICMAACWRLQRWPKTTWLLTLASVSNLLYHFPPLMAVLGELAADPRWTDKEVLDRETLLGLWARPEILSLWLHFILASIAVGFVAALAASVPCTNDESGAQTAATAPSPADRIARPLAGAALAATLLQVPVGLWLLFSSDEAAQQSMLGGSWLATMGLAGGVWVSLGVMQSLATIAWGGSDRRQLRRTSFLLGLTVLLMSATLRGSRQVGIEPVVQAEVQAPN